MFAERTNWDLRPNRLSQALARHRAAKNPLIDLTISNPTECGFEYERETILRALSNPDSLRYAPDPRGLESAREAVAAYYSERRLGISPCDIILTASTSEAYSFIFRLLCNPGDEILIPALSYPLFDFLAEVQDVKLVRYPLLYDHGWQIDFPALERAIMPPGKRKTRAIILVHPNNPTGHFAKSDEIARLNDICAARELAIIADEVFLDFGVRSEAERSYSFAANSASLTLTLSGLSKISGLPQMKVAWIVVSGPSALKAEALARLEVLGDTFLSVGTPVQLALPRLLEGSNVFQKQMMARIEQNLAELDHQLAAQKPCSRLEMEGGWYAVLRVPATCSSEDLAVDLLTSKNTYIHPGSFFDFPGEGYLVASLIGPPSDFRVGIAGLLSMF